METTGKDSLTFGDDSAEEKYSSAGEDYGSDNMGKETRRIVDAPVIETTVESDVPAATSLGGEVDQALRGDSTCSGEATSRDIQKESQTDNDLAEVGSGESNREDQANDSVGSGESIGEDQANEESGEEVISPGGTITGGAAEGWSIVDSSPDDAYGNTAQLEAQPRGEDMPDFAYNDKPPSSLRRRTRHSSNASEGGSSSVDRDDPNTPSASRESQNIPQSNDEPFYGISEDTKGKSQLQDRDSEETKGKSQLQYEDSDTVSEVDNGQLLLRKGGSEFRSGYDSDDENEATSCKEAGDGVDSLEGSASPEGRRLEEVGSSSRLDMGGRTSEIGHRREVYRMPDNDGDGEGDGGAESEDLVHPAGFIFQAVGVQVKLIARLIAFAFWLLNFSVSLISRPINRTLEVKDKAADMASGAVNQGFGLMSSIREGVSQTGPAINKLSRKTIWGCLGAAYVLFMLSLLLVPALIFGLFFVRRIVQDPVSIRETLDFDYTQPRPSVLLPLFSLQELERVKGLAPHKTVTTRVIPAGHKFHVTAFLTLPESEHNLNLGMFQMSAELLSARDQIILRSSKPCRLRFSSYPVRLAKTILFSVPLLMGFYSEAQTLEIRILEAEEKVTPTAAIRIYLEPQPSKEGGVPELYKAEVHVESTLPWSKATIRRWKWTFYVWVALCLFLFEISLVLCCCRQALMPGLGSQQVVEEKAVKGDVKEERPSRGNRSSPRGKSKTRVYFEDSMPGTTSEQGMEDSGTPIDEEDGSMEDVGSSERRDVDRSVPPLETTESVDVEEIVTNLGDALGEGVAEVHQASP